MKAYAATALFLALLAPFCRLSAQYTTADSALSIGMFHVSYGYGYPMADMAKRFYSSNQIGAGYDFKTKKGWSFGLEGNFMFRDKIRDSQALIQHIATEGGFVITYSGVFANVMILERGFTVFGKFGKTIPLKTAAPNAGILIEGGLGVLQHKIRIDVAQNSVPSLTGDYKKGYDKLCSGPAAMQFVGYRHLSKNHRINFFGGVEAVEAYTVSRRRYYFDEMKMADEKRLDVLVSLKVGWILPLYNRTRQQFYYY